MTTRTVASATRPGSPGSLRLSARAVALLVAAGGAVTVGAWVMNTPGVYGLGGWLTNAGRLTGLLAGYLLAVALVMMSRMPALDRSLGSDWLARWHAFLGRYVVCLLAAHTVLIIWGYAVTAHTGVVSETGTLWSSYPDVLMATVAFGLFLLVAVFSVRRARRRVAYETWFYLHLYTYLALALSFAHSFANGAEFVSSTFNRLLWSALYIAAVGCVVWWRFVTPVLLNWRLSPRVHAVRRENAHVVSVIVRGNDFTVLHAQPGQYFRLRFMTRDGWWHTHPYSLSAEPRRDYLRFTIKALGDGSRFAARVRPGTRVWMSGPYGAITAEKAGGRKVLLLAGGIGVTPLRALAERLTRRSGRAEVTMLYRANNAADLVLRPELEALAAKGGMRLSVLLGPPGDQSDPLVGTRLRSLLPDVADREVFVCGPPAFVTAACDALRRCRLPDAQVHAEKFAVEV